jgi:CrcB protein
LLPEEVRLKDVTWRGFLAVGVGGVIGCWIRYVLSALLNPLFLHLPPGTLAANWIAAFLIGCLVGIFQRFESLPVEVRLLTTTGILGGLSTYSTFSSEAVGFLLAGQYRWFALHVTSHVFGSLLLTLLGIYFVHKMFHKQYREMDNPEPEK